MSARLVLVAGLVAGMLQLVPAVRADEAPADDSGASQAARPPAKEAKPTPAAPAPAQPSMGEDKPATDAMGTREEAAEKEAAPRSSAKEAVNVLGGKEWKERINVVARKPLRHDIEWIDGQDRTNWHEFNLWHGLRDERPMIARKTLGFHAPDPHRTRQERVLLLSRGPLRGPAPAK